MTNVSNRSLSLLSWNVRGLSDPEKCSIVRDAIQSASPSVMCIQESKLHELNSFKTIRGCLVPAATRHVESKAATPARLTFGSGVSCGCHIFSPLSFASRAWRVVASSFTAAAVATSLTRG
jgi:hypothetical protein